MTSDDAAYPLQLAPVDFLVVEFPGGEVSSGGFDRLLDLVDGGHIAILDAEFVRRDNDGSATICRPAELPVQAGVDLSVWEGASSGLLDAADLAALSQQLQPGSAGLVVILENLWLLNVVAGWPGARLVADGGVPVSELERALDATEPHHVEA